MSEPGNTLAHGDMCREEKISGLKFSGGGRVKLPGRGMRPVCSGRTTVVGIYAECRGKLERDRKFQSGNKIFLDMRSFTCLMFGPGRVAGLQLPAKFIKQGHFGLCRTSRDGPNLQETKQCGDCDYARQ